MLHEISFDMYSINFSRKLIVIDREEEQKATLRVGTSDLLDMLTSDEPGVDFTLALGADTFIDLARGKWRRTDDIFRLVGSRMVVFQRVSEDDNNTDDEFAKKTDQIMLQESIATCQQLINNATQSSIRVIQIESLSNVSSSAVRRATDEEIMKNMVSQDVLKYIKRHRMYSLSEQKTE